MISDSLSTWSLLSLPLLGFLIGVFVTMFGGGGGFFYVPILTLLFKIPTQLAVATSLASIIPTTIAGTIGHYRKGNLNLPIGAVFGVGGLAGAFAGAYLSTLISSALLGKLFGALMIALTVPMVLRSRRKGAETKADKEKERAFTAPRALVSVLFGLLSGIMAGLFGVSGTAPVISGLYLLGLPATVVVGTSVFVLFFNALSGLAGHLMLGRLNLTLLICLGGGATAGALAGPTFLACINVRTLEKVYAVFFPILVVGLGIAVILK